MALPPIAGPVGPRRLGASASAPVLPSALAPRPRAAPSGRDGSTARLLDQGVSTEMDQRNKRYEQIERHVKKAKLQPKVSGWSKVRKHYGKLKLLGAMSTALDETKAQIEFEQDKQKASRLIRAVTQNLDEIAKAPRAPVKLVRAMTQQIEAKEERQKSHARRKPKSQAPDGLGNSRYQKSVDEKIERAKHREDFAPGKSPTYVYRSGNLRETLPDPRLMAAAQKSHDYYLDPGFAKPPLAMSFTPEPPPYFPHVNRDPAELHRFRHSQRAAFALEQGDIQWERDYFVRQKREEMREFKEALSSTQTLLRRQQGAWLAIGRGYALRNGVGAVPCRQYAWLLHLFTMLASRRWAQVFAHKRRIKRNVASVGPAVVVQRMYRARADQSRIRHRAQTMQRWTRTIKPVWFAARLLHAWKRRHHFGDVLHDVLFPAIRTMKVRMLIRRMGAQMSRIQRTWRSVSFRNKLRFCVFSNLFVEAEEKNPGRTVPEQFRFGCINTWLRNQYRLAQERLEQEQMGFRPASRRTIEEEALKALDLGELLPTRLREVPTRWWKITDSTFPLLVDEARRCMKPAKFLRANKSVGHLLEVANSAARRAEGRAEHARKTSKEAGRKMIRSRTCVADMRGAAQRISKASKESEPD